MSKIKYQLLPFAGMLLAFQATTVMAENGLVELRVKTPKLPRIASNNIDQVTTATATQKRNLDILTSKPEISEMPRWIAVSLNEQQLKLYQGAEIISRSNISSGKSGHSTPTGIFSILGKKKYHESNIYSNAPMPFMQRLTWSGIALHQSKSVPSYPASHGCVRLPAGFAKQLYGETSHGIHVIISPEEVAPKWVNHPSLFYTNRTDINLAALRTGITDYDADGTNRQKASETKAKPLRIYITRTTRRDEIRFVQSRLLDLGYTYEEPDGLYGKKSIETVKRFQSHNGLKRTGTITDELLQTLTKLSDGKSPPRAKIYIRQDKKPIYETEIELRQPEKPLGTHLLMTSPNAANDEPWLSISISSKIPSGIIRDHGLDKALKNTRVFANIKEALDRIVVPAEAEQFIEARLEGGASLAISDNGLGSETGKGTDFIVQTH